MMRLFKDSTARIGSKQADTGKLLRGVFVQRERPEYCVQYDNIIQSAMAGRTGKKQ